MSVSLHYCTLLYSIIIILDIHRAMTLFEQELVRGAHLPTNVSRHYARSKR